MRSCSQAVRLWHLRLNFNRRPDPNRRGRRPRARPSPSRTTRNRTPSFMQQQDILINWSPQETRVAIVEGGSVQELHIERSLERGLVGNVYLGKVVRVLPGMQPAFIDIGLERAAFLHVADVWHRQEGGEAPMFARNKHEAHEPIERQLL